MSIQTAPFTTITYLDATEDGSLILMDKPLGTVLYEGKNVNSIVDCLKTFGFDSDDYMAGSTLCENEMLINKFNLCIDLCLVQWYNNL